MKFQIKKNLLVVSAIVVAVAGLLVVLYDDMFSGRWDDLTSGWHKTDATMTNTLVVVAILALLLILAGLHMFWDHLRWYWWFKRRRQKKDQ